MLSATVDLSTMPPYTPVEDDDDFEIIIDEPLLCVVRCNGKVAAQVHAPLDLTELHYRLAEEGYMATDMMCYEDGVLELLLRELGDIPVDMPEVEARVMTEVAKHVREEKEKEGIYA